MKIAIMMRAHYEGFGLTLLEAMTCGCPVVASSTGASGKGKSTNHRIGY